MQDRYHHYDVIVIGAGLIGLSLACRLLSLGQRVLILESKAAVDTDPKDETVDQQLIALNMASQRYLEKLGVWEALQCDTEVVPFREMLVWDGSGSGRLCFEASKLNLRDELLGFIVQSARLKSVLRQRLKVYDQGVLKSAVQMDSLQQEVESISVALKDGSRYSAALLVGADGARSWVRHQACIGSYQKSYGQCAMTAVVETEYPHRQVAAQCFLPTGPLAFLPWNQAHRCGVVWSADFETAKSLYQLPDEAFNRALAEAFGYRLGRVATVGHRGYFALQCLQAKQYVKPRLVLVGDAAHVVHPLAGQGANLGFGDIIYLSDLLSTALSQGKDISDLSLLHRYQRARRAENALMMSVLNKLFWLFSKNALGVPTIRGFGMNIINRLNVLKRLLAVYAVGEG